MIPLLKRKTGRQKKFLALPAKSCRFIKNRAIINDGMPADVAKLADAPDLGSGSVRSVGSSPIIRTHWLQEPLLPPHLKKLITSKSQ